MTCTLAFVPINNVSSGPHYDNNESNVQVPLSLAVRPAISEIRGDFIFYFLAVER